jgi:hypothetical protein
VGGTQRLLNTIEGGGFDDADASVCCEGMRERKGGNDGGNGEAKEGRQKATKERKERIDENKRETEEGKQEDQRNPGKETHRVPVHARHFLLLAKEGRKERRKDERARKGGCHIL